jgi:hypothetical protein
MPPIAAINMGETIIKVDVNMPFPLPFYIDILAGFPIYVIDVFLLIFFKNY